MHTKHNLLLELINNYTNYENSDIILIKLEIITCISTHLLMLICIH